MGIMSCLGGGINLHFLNAFFSSELGCMYKAISIHHIMLSEE